MASANVSVPECSAHVSAGQYNSQAQATFNVQSWNYYKGYVKSAQVIPGIVFGILCWVVAFAFVVWLLTLCCRNVGWRSRRTRTHDTPAKGRNKWAAFNLVLFLCVLGTIGAGTWALVVGLKTTDGQVDEFWGIVGTARGKLVAISGTLDGSTAAITDLQVSVGASYRLVDNNQAALTVLGVDAPGTLSLLSSFNSTLTNGRASTQKANANVQENGVVTVEDLQANYEGKTRDAWSTWRRIVVAVFFGLLILFGTLAGFLALLDRTPRLSASSTLVLWVWAGVVLLLGAGLLNLVWRVSRDGCLYGVDYVAEQVGGGSNTQVVIDYYFGRTYIAPEDVSQRLFGTNLTDIIGTLADPKIGDLVDRTQSAGGQVLVATASADDRVAINALEARVSSLRGNLTSLNSQIQEGNFNGVTQGALGLVCCSSTTALWKLWLASVITGAIAGLLAVLTLAKVVTSVQPLEARYSHYSPHAPNGALLSTKHGVP